MPISEVMNIALIVVVLITNNLVHNVKHATRFKGETDDWSITDPEVHELGKRLGGRESLRAG